MCHVVATCVLYVSRRGNLCSVCVTSWQLVFCMCHVVATCVLYVSRRGNLCSVCVTSWQLVFCMCHVVATCVLFVSRRGNLCSVCIQLSAQIVTAPCFTINISKHVVCFKCIYTSTEERRNMWSGRWRLLSGDLPAVLSFYWFWTVVHTTFNRYPCY